MCLSETHASGNREAQVMLIPHAKATMEKDFFFFTGMAARDRAEARQVIASSLHLPPVDNEVTLASFQKFPIFRLFVPTRTLQHGSISGCCARACDAGRCECAPEGNVHSRECCWVHVPNEKQMSLVCSR